LILGGLFLFLNHISRIVVMTIFILIAFELYKAILDYFDHFDVFLAILAILYLSIPILINVKKKGLKDLTK
jgi:hypothetical protein